MATDLRNLLISLSSHMAYMQGQLEARHELDDPEDFYWYRESVLLRQKVTDALADEPAVPEGREPVSVTGQFTFPADGEVAKLVKWLRQRWPRMAHISDLDYAIGVRIGDLMERLSPLRPVPVSERLPGPEDCKDEGWAWFFNKRIGWRQAVLPVSSSFTHWLSAHALPLPEVR